MEPGKKPILHDLQFLGICFLEPIPTLNSLLISIQTGNQNVFGCLKKLQEDLEGVKVRENGCNLVEK